MIPILNKKEFYKMLLKDRFPVACVDFPTGRGNGRIEFINTPIGTLLHIFSNAVVPKEIKMYNRNLGDFTLQNVICGDSLVSLDDGSYISLSSQIQIEDVIGRSFLIKINDMNVIARAEFLPINRCDVDKSRAMVYN